MQTTALGCLVAVLLNELKEFSAYPPHALDLEPTLSPGGSPRTWEDELNDQKKICTIEFENKGHNEPLPDFLVYKYSQYTPNHRVSRPIGSVSDLQLIPSSTAVLDENILNKRDSYIGRAGQFFN